MKVIYYKFSLLFLIVSVFSFAALWWCDAWRGFHYDAAHARMGALPFVFIGIAFVCYQLSLQRPWRQRVKGLLLGAAFAIWGSEQFVEAGNWLTVLDDLVIGIFIVDLGLIVCGHWFENK